MTDKINEIKERLAKSEKPITTPGGTVEFTFISSWAIQDIRYLIERVKELEETNHCLYLLKEEQFRDNVELKNKIKELQDLDKTAKEHYLRNIASEDKDEYLHHLRALEKVKEAAEKCINFNQASQQIGELEGLRNNLKQALEGCKE